jgi:hypothetical protein
MRYVAHVEGMRNTYKIFVRKLERKRPHEDQGVYRTILQWILENKMGGCGMN